jgi:hypothetical protein
VIKLSGVWQDRGSRVIWWNLCGIIDRHMGE